MRGNHQNTGISRAINEEPSKKNRNFASATSKKKLCSSNRNSPVFMRHGKKFEVAISTRFLDTRKDTKLYY